MIERTHSVLVELSDELVAQLDRRACAAGISRSALIRELLEAGLADDRSARVSRQIVEGYARIPQQPASDAWGDLDQWTEANTRRNLAALDAEEADKW